MKSKKLIDSIQSGTLEIHERTSQYFDTIEKKNSDINALITFYKEEALVKARNLDKKIANGEDAGPLCGLSLALKDNIAVKDMPLTCGSKMLANYMSPYNATITQRVLDADAIVLGKANMDEFACGSSGESSAFGVTKNPLDVTRVPGGSSSGSAAAVAAQFCDMALGSDTGGSIRCPASFCGVTGIKPSYGKVSRYGLVDMAMSLEGPGPLAHDVYGTALLLSVIAGEDGRDNVCSGQTHDFTKYCTGDVTNMRIGVPQEFFTGVDSSVETIIKQSIQSLERKGAQIVDISIPSISYAIAMYYLIVFSEFSSAMSKYDGLKYGNRSTQDLEGLVESVSISRSESLGNEVKRRILIGTYITMKEFRGKWYTTALKARSLLKQEFDAAFTKADVLLGPTMPVLPWKLGELVDDPASMYVMDICTVTANLAGICAGSVPVGTHSDLSVGAQIQAPHNGEDKLFKALSALEEGSQ